ncbi:hypothetical protein [Flagellimonas maritima]|nr:hypothetical protein [Allomuricauda aurantiaca]
MRFVFFEDFKLSLYNKRKNMFEFDQYLGFLAFLTILTIGFWLMIFLLTFVVPYWLFGNLMEMYKERREAKRAARNE